MSSIFLIPAILADQSTRVFVHFMDEYMCLHTCVIISSEGKLFKKKNYIQTMMLLSNEVIYLKCIYFFLNLAHK